MTNENDEQIIEKHFKYYQSKTTNWKMVLKPACLTLILNLIPFVCLFDYQKPLAEKLWRQRCVRNSLVLNDCNWCWCSENFRYTCNAKVCGGVDMFGHFNDAIQDINVGMEGHGVWRTTASACEPGVHYSREGLLCVCTEDGSWPNPVCRDTFRILHPVKVVQNFELSDAQKCSPTKLYLAECNVCLCPSTGVIDSNLCTQKNCTTDDLLIRSEKSYEIEEVYAECKNYQKYKLGCKNCICLRNNRLICDNCTKRSECEGRRPGDNFNVDCNTCHCDAKGTIYCTINRCLNSLEEIDILKNTKMERKVAREIVQKYEGLKCIPGTRYMQNCNTCYCFQKRGEIRKYGCTLKKCHASDATKECEIGDAWNKECQLCHCELYNGLIMEVCQSDPKCLKPHEQKNKNTLRSRHREYTLQECKPNHVYTNDCNTCKCSPDGKSVSCTEYDCQAEPSTISLNIVPVVQNLPECPKGHSYKIGCNYCLCLSNGNAMCTTTNCKREDKSF